MRHPALAVAHALDLHDEVDRAGDLDTDGTLTQLQGTQRLIPASLSKIVIASTALDTWAPDKTFSTELRAASAPRTGTLHGDLILRGSGDATLDETTLWGLAAQLRGAGVRRITGKLVVEVGATFTGTCNMGPMIKDMHNSEKQNELKEKAAS